VKCTKPAAKLEFYVQKNIGGAKVQYQNLSLWKKAKTSPSGNNGTIHPSANFNGGLESQSGNKNRSAKTNVNSEY